MTFIKEEFIYIEKFFNVLENDYLRGRFLIYYTTREAFLGAKLYKSIKKKDKKYIFLWEGEDNLTQNI